MNLHLLGPGRRAGSLPSIRPRIAMISTHGYVAGTPPLGAADTGGQVVYVLELARKLALLGFEVDIWTRQFEGQVPAEQVAPHVTLLRVPCGGPGFIRKEALWEFIPEWCENALRVIRAESREYRFINSHYWDAGLAGAHLADVMDIPHLHTPHSLGIWKQRTMAQDFSGSEAELEARYNFGRRIREETALCRQASLVIATTSEQADMLREDYGVPPDSIATIPPGYDDSRFFPVGEASRSAIRARLGFQGPTILAIGRLARNKGYDLLIRGFSVLARRVPDARLHLAVGGEQLSPGERALLGELHDLAIECGVIDRVAFGGFVRDGELADHYRAADVFVLSSRYEPFGMTAIEAMACGTPTVVTIHGGLYRALTFGRHALFSDVLDPEDLGITIAKILRHPRLRQRLARMGAHKARSLFTWTGVAQQLLALVEERSTTAFRAGDGDWDEPWNDGD